MRSVPRAVEGIRGAGSGIASRCEPGTNRGSEGAELGEERKGCARLVVERMGDRANTKVCVRAVVSDDCRAGFRPRGREGAGTSSRKGIDARSPQSGRQDREMFA